MTAQSEQFKQRLVGAIVLSALAVIFLPMLFDEEVKQGSLAGQQIPQFPREFEKNIQPIPTHQQISGKIRGVKKRLSNLSDERSKQLKSWVVQVGSFVEKANADVLENALRKADFAAFVETVDESTGTRFRVRVGPLLNRELAKNISKQIEHEFDMKGLLVEYP